MPRIAEEKDAQPDSASEPKHLFATIDALTVLGGRITKATGGLAVAGLTVARIGDVVTYEDGSEAAITDGAGEYAVDNDKPIALVGSRLATATSSRIALSGQHGLIHRVHCREAFDRERLMRRGA